MIGSDVEGRVAAALLAILFAAGCGSDEKGRVAGSVSYQGAPLRVGAVNLYNPQNGTGATAPLDDNGQFALPGRVPVGEYTVYLSPPAPFMPDMQDAHRPKRLQLDLSDFPSIPQKFLAQATSDLRVDVQGGENNFQIKIPE